MHQFFAALAALGLLVSSHIEAQDVSTVLPPGSSINDGIAIGPEGAIYVAAHEARKVHRLTLDGTHTVLDHSFNGPNGLAVDGDGNVYVANALGNSISKVTPAGEISRFAEGINNPGGLAFGPDGRLYVTEKDDDRISIIDRDGVVEHWVEGMGITRPVGLVVDGGGTVYVSSLVDGGIHRISPAGQAELLASIPFTAPLAIGFITLAQGKIYATALNNHLIYEVSLDGQVRIFAGTGVNGGASGPAAEAQFNGPHGIAYNPVDHALYVSDFNTKSLRRIALPLPTAIAQSTWALTKKSVEKNK